MCMIWEGSGHQLLWRQWNGRGIGGGRWAVIVTRNCMSVFWQLVCMGEDSEGRVRNADEVVS